MEKKNLTNPTHTKKKKKKKKKWIKNLHDVLGNGNSANVLQDKCSTQRQCLIPEKFKEKCKKKKIEKTK